MLATTTILILKWDFLRNIFVSLHFACKIYRQQVFNEKFYAFICILSLLLKSIITSPLYENENGFLKHTVVFIEWFSFIKLNFITNNQSLKVH